MATKSIEIQVQDDHLQRISQVRKPILAVAELIWNALDADADRVDVEIADDGMGGINSIRVSDRGHGIPYSEIESLFSRLGGSWKRGAKVSKIKKRLLHGQEGRGRFRALSLGRVVDWNIAYSLDGTLRSYTVSMIRDNPKTVNISDEAAAPVGLNVGVTVTVSELGKNFRSLQVDAAISELIQVFALYLKQYPDIKMYYSHALIDPKSAQDHSEIIPLPSIVLSATERYPASLEVVEWKVKAERRIYLCDAAGFPLDEAPANIQAPGFDFTAYLKSDYFAKLAADNRLDLANLDGDGSQLLSAAREAMRAHFRARAAAKVAGLVKEWKDQKVYPYSSEPVSKVEEAERQVFNVVALNVNHYLPAFQAADETSKRLQMRLLRHAIESAPGDLTRILNDVLDLPADKRQELNALLDRTTLAAIISASKVISDRLEFLQGLDTLIFDPQYKDAVGERTQLHRIVAENSWMFGEQYSLSIDDQSLTEVLKKHLTLKRREAEIDEPVLRADGTRGIIDLMFSRSIQIAGSEQREHLIVELKRPNVPIDADVVAQIQSYAFAVADDERFRAVPAKWVFWAISNDVDSAATRLASQKDRAKGIIYQDDEQRITIWVKSWSQIINECRSRLLFFSEKLNYAPDRDSSLQHLQNTYPKYLSDLFSPPVGKKRA